MVLFCPTATDRAGSPLLKSWWLSTRAVMTQWPSRDSGKHPPLGAMRHAEHQSGSQLEQRPRHK
jgi:hypothetical protein